MAFTPGRRLSQDQILPPLWFILDRGQVLVRQGEEGCSFLDPDDLHALALEELTGFCLGATDARACLLAHGDASLPVPERYTWAEVRTLFGVVGEELFWVAGRAHHLALWDRAHRYCGTCGAGLLLKEEEWAKACPSCGLLLFPQISPAVIVSVVDGDRILLARNRHYRYPFFSVLAGFVEPGEDLETAIHREIQEEVGLKVKNLRYFGSQPWPFPNSLMIAFTADYAGGELCPDSDEILEARWFTRNALPEIPSSLSIAHRLIRAFTG